MNNICLLFSLLWLAHRTASWHRCQVCTQVQDIHTVIITMHRESSTLAGKLLIEISNVGVSWSHDTDGGADPKLTLDDGLQTLSVFNSTICPDWPIIEHTFHFVHTNMHLSCPIFLICRTHVHMQNCSLHSFSNENNTALEIYAKTYAGGVAEALIRLKNLVLDPPSKSPITQTHTCTETTPTASTAEKLALCAKPFLSSPVKMGAKNSIWSEEINCNLSVINGEHLWDIMAARLQWAPSVDCANESWLSHTSLSWQRKGNTTIMLYHN